jgi:hypothetical protein
MNNPSSVAQYTLSPFTGVRGSWHKTPLARDMASEPHTIINKQLEAEVHSGDYFITLATKLDSLNRDIEDYATRSEIENAVSDLIYLYDNYVINKRESPTA